MSGQRALRRGKRELRPRELEALQRKHANLEAAVATYGWRSREHDRARRQLGDYLAQLADAGVPHSRLADALGSHKSRPGQLMAAAERS